LPRGIALPPFRIYMNKIVTFSNVSHISSRKDERDRCRRTARPRSPDVRRRRECRRCDIQHKTDARDRRVTSSYSGSANPCRAKPRRAATRPQSHRTERQSVRQRRMQPARERPADNQEQDCSQGDSFKRDEDRRFRGRQNPARKYIFADMGRSQGNLSCGVLCKIVRAKIVSNITFDFGLPTVAFCSSTSSRADRWQTLS
jgi:hypothetical protein